MPSSFPDKHSVDPDCLNAEVEAIRALIDQRRAESLVDLEEGEAEIYKMLELKKQARASR
ncbi:hypothetical protein DS837_02690 [Azospirillum brasilense]|uniref:Uncharacterized protein n=2 Tax=Azospirillum brasilense TaxID=192 RepID=A0A6L3B6I0_AZOBR|nr:hypothetical protein DS837_02690 [Azospirillum brasilense]